MAPATLKPLAVQRQQFLKYVYFWTVCLNVKTVSLANAVPFFMALLELCVEAVIPLLFVNEIM